MPESRDRLSRPEDVAALFARRQQSLRGFGSFSDDLQTGSGAAFRRGAAATLGGGVPRRSLGTPGSGHSRGRNLSGSPVVGLENMPARNFRRGQGQGRGSELPSWYPRTPLRDITSVVRAIERRRGSLRESEGLQLDSPLPQGQDQASEPLLGAQLEHNLSLFSPNPRVGKKSCVTFDDNQNVEGTADCLTSVKSLLNSIDTVEKVVMEELRKLKRTPGARKAERERKVRTLMSLR